jgi:hypothetical protein
MDVGNLKGVDLDAFLFRVITCTYQYGISP